MSFTSKIEWTTTSWNPVTGCTKVSPGCKNCYAERMAKRLQVMGSPNYKDGFKVAMHERTLTQPLHWKKPRLVFVNSMSDLFHKDVPLEFIQKIFDVMGKASWHQFQVLTKRSERLLELNPLLKWHKNIWMGVSVETSKFHYRISSLQDTDAFMKFISFEPLLEEISEVDLTGIDWVIVGGESGPYARIIKKSWVRKLRDISNSKGVPFFFKQWGGINKKKSGRILDGRIWEEMPKFCQPALKLGTYRDRL